MKRCILTTSYDLRRTLATTATLVVLATVGCSQAQTSILINDFEAGTQNWASAYTFLGVGGTAGPDSQSLFDFPASPVNSRVLLTDGNWQGGALTAPAVVWEQSVAVPFEADWVFSLWATDTSPDGFDPQVQLDLYFDNPTATSGPNTSWILADWNNGSGWLQYTASVHLTGGSHTFTLRDPISPAVQNGNDFIIDNPTLSTNAVPEPSGTIAACCGGLLCLLRRKRPA